MPVRPSLLGFLILGATLLPAGSASPVSAAAAVSVSAKVLLERPSPASDVPEPRGSRFGCGFCQYNILITYDWFSCSNQPHAGSCEPHNLIPGDEHCHWSSEGSCQLASLDRGLGGVLLAATSSCSNDSGQSVYFDGAIVSNARGVREFEGGTKRGVHD